MLDKLDKMKINKESSDSDIQECIDLGSDPSTATASVITTASKVTCWKLSNLFPNTIDILYFFHIL
jgi:hypothetical protein